MTHVLPLHQAVSSFLDAVKILPLKLCIVMTSVELYTFIIPDFMTKANCQVNRRVWKKE